MPTKADKYARIIKNGGLVLDDGDSIGVTSSSDAIILNADGTVSVIVKDDSGNDYLTSASSVGSLSDIDVTTPSSNDLLQFDSSNWVNVTLSSVLGADTASDGDVFIASGGDAVWQSFPDVESIGHGGAPEGTILTAGPNNTTTFEEVESAISPFLLMGA